MNPLAFLMQNVMLSLINFIIIILITTAKETKENIEKSIFNNTLNSFQ